MAFVAGAAMAMELVELIGGAAAGAEAVADVAAAAEAIAMEEAVPLMETAVGRTVSGRAVSSFAAYSSAARAGSIARALGASGLVASAVTGAVSARSAKKAVDKLSSILGKRKSGADRGTASLSPAHPTPRVPSRPALPMPRKASKKSTKRAAKRTKSVKQTKSKKRATSKKTKPKKKGPARSKLYSYDTHGVIQRNDVSYFGFQNTGGRQELLKLAADSVLRALLRKFKIQIRSVDENLNVASSVPAVSRFRLWFRRRQYADGTDDGYVSEDFTLSGVTYKQAVTSLKNALRDRAEAGYFPYSMFSYNYGGVNDAANEVTRDVKFGEAKLSLAVTRSVKLRNITPNDGDGTDRFALDTNPLQGVFYKFGNDVPVVKEALYETNTSEFAKFHDRNVYRGIQFGPQRAAGVSGGVAHDGAPAAVTVMETDKILSVPPKNGKMVWGNCVSSAGFEMSPGREVVHKMKYTFNGTLTNFLMKFYDGSYRTPRIGVCHWFGLQQKFRQNRKVAEGLEAQSGHDHVTVEYDLDTHMSGGASFVAAAKALRTVDTDVYTSIAT